MRPMMKPDGRSTIVAELVTFLPLAIVVLAALEFVARHGAGHVELVRIGGAVLLTQMLPGALIWRALRPRDGWLLADLALGAGVGAALAIPAAVLSVLLGTHLVDWLLAWLVVAVLLALPGSRQRILTARCVPLPAWWGIGVAAGAAMMLGLMMVSLRQPLPGSRDWTTQYVDIPFHIALVADLQQRFPPDLPHLAGEPLYYHWFSHAWMAQIGSTSGVDLDVVLARFVPVYGSATIAVTLAFLAMRLVGRVGAGPLAAVAAVLVNPMALTVPWHLSLPASALSPSTSLATFLSVPLVVLLVHRWRGESPAWSWPAVLLLALAGGGSKGSWLPVLLLGAVLAALAAWFGRSTYRRRVTVDLGLVVLALAFVMRVLLGGRAGAAELTFFDSLAETSGKVFAPRPDEGWSPGQVALITVIAVVCMLLPYLVAFFALRRDRWDPVFWMLVGITAAGVGALLVFTHPGAGQLYFWRVAAPLAVLAAVWGVCAVIGTGTLGWVVAGLAMVFGWLVMGPLHDLLPGAGEHGIGPSYALLGSFLLVLVLAACATWWWLRRGDAERGHRRHSAGALLTVLALVSVGLFGAATSGKVDLLGRSVPVQVVLGEPLPPLLSAGPRRGGAVSAGEVRAMEYIAEHADPEDVVMTNRHCRDLRTKRCDNRRFWLAALGEHRVLLEGWAYSPQTNALDKGVRDHSADRAQFWDQDLQELNDSFYVQPTAEAAERLYELGVRWVFVDRRLPHPGDLSDVATRVFRNQEAAVYRLDPPSG